MNLYRKKNGKLWKIIENERKTIDFSKEYEIVFGKIKKNWLENKYQRKPQKKFE